MELSRLSTHFPGDVFFFIEGACDMADSRVFNASRFLLKMGEHTWGLPSVYDTVNWTNPAFYRASSGKMKDPEAVTVINVDIFTQYVFFFSFRIGS